MSSLSNITPGELDEALNCAMKIALRNPEFEYKGWQVLQGGSCFTAADVDLVQEDHAVISAPRGQMRPREEGCMIIFMYSFIH